MSSTSILGLKIPELMPPARKSKTITFRVTNEFYEILENMAGKNKVTLSKLISHAIEDYWFIQKETYTKAQYLNTCDDETRSEILLRELNYPFPCRQFTNALHAYPNAEKLDNDEMERIDGYYKGMGVGK